jgi:mannose-6-phosphate isomerase-like protein (cupin superfamily)
MALTPQRRASWDVTVQVLAIDSADLSEEFGITVGRWTQYTTAGDLPFGAMWCVVPPGGRSNTDQHPDRELFVVVRGTGEVQVPDGPARPASAGTAVLMNAGEPHVLVNRSATEPLVALSLYWIPEGRDEGDVP